MPKIKTIGQTELEIRPNLPELGKNLTFDLLLPANKNFRKDTELSLSLSSGSKIMPNIKKSKEAFLRYFEKH